MRTLMNSKYRAILKGHGQVFLCMTLSFEENKSNTQVSENVDHIFV